LRKQLKQILEKYISSTLTIKTCSDDIERLFKQRIRTLPSSVKLYSKLKLNTLINNLKNDNISDNDIESIIAILESLKPKKAKK